jgi:exonuclease SbcC
MHLKSLTIKNFKSHADSIVEFDTITSITGKNNSGKTNIIRALKVLLHHGDWPVTWIRYGQESASIELVLVDGTKVIRKRTKSNQSVEIHTAGKIETYEGKKDATEFIEKAIGIRKITLDESTGPEDLNFVEVNEGPYLLGGRSDTVQRKVAGIVGANGIEDAKSRILKKAKDLETQSKSLNADIAEISSTVSASRTNLDSIQKLLKNAENLHDQWDQHQTKLQSLHNFRYHINSLTSLIPTDIVGKKLLNLHQKCKEISDSLREINSKIDQGLGLKRSIKAYSSDSTSLVSKYSETNDIVSKLKKINNSISELTKFKEIQILKETIAKDEDSLAATKKEMNTVLKDKENKLKELGVCPLCKKKI